METICTAEEMASIIRSLQPQKYREKSQVVYDRAKSYLEQAYQLYKKQRK